MDIHLHRTPQGLNLYEERSRLSDVQLARWQGLPLCWVDASPNTATRGSVSESPVLALLDAGVAEADIDFGQRRVHLEVASGAMGLFLPGETRASRWRCAGVRRIMVDLDLLKVAGSGLDSGDFQPSAWREDLEFRDAGMTTLLRAMAQEVQAGCPGGRLYAETASLALLTGLQARCGRRRSASRERGRLMQAQLTRVDDYIEQHLASGALSLAALAAVVCLSAPHFTRLFRAATGSSPHQHVMHKRVQRARELLQRTAMPLTAVAQAAGFASQSHMNESVGAALGVTPGTLRRESAPEFLSPR